VTGEGFAYLVYRREAGRDQRQDTERRARQRPTPADIRGKSLERLVLGPRCSNCLRIEAFDDQPDARRKLKYCDQKRRQTGQRAMLVDSAEQHGEIADDEQGPPIEPALCRPSSIAGQRSATDWGSTPAVRPSKPSAMPCAARCPARRPGCPRSPPPSLGAMPRWPCSTRPGVDPVEKQPDLPVAKQGPRVVAGRLLQRIDGHDLLPVESHRHPETAPTRSADPSTRDSACLGTGRRFGCAGSVERTSAFALGLRLHHHKCHVPYPAVRLLRRLDQHHESFMGFV
jgi:hypothetical protein